LIKLVIMNDKIKYSSDQKKMHHNAIKAIPVRAKTFKAILANYVS